MKMLLDKELVLKTITTHLNLNCIERDSDVWNFAEQLIKALGGKNIMKEYIGDSVYIEFDGYALVLTTENGLPNDPSNRIVLEPEVYESLTKFVGRIK
jgi:hypothetical protein